MICVSCKKEFFNGVANQQVCEDCLGKDKNKKTEEAKKISNKDIVQIKGYETKYYEEYDIKVKIEDISIGVLVKILLFNLVLGFIFAGILNSTYG